MLSEKDDIVFALEADVSTLRVAQRKNEEYVALLRSKAAAAEAVNGLFAPKKDYPRLGRSIGRMDVDRLEKHPIALDHVLSKKDDSVSAFEADLLPTQAAERKRNEYVESLGSNAAAAKAVDDLFLPEAVHHRSDKSIARVDVDRLEHHPTEEDRVLPKKDNFVYDPGVDVSVHRTEHVEKERRESYQMEERGTTERFVKGLKEEV